MKSSTKLAIASTKLALASIKSAFAFSLALMSLLMTMHANANNSAGELELRDQGGNVTNALLLDTAISGDVNGMLATIKVKQTFRNDSDQWLNGRYVFPLPEGAAVDSLTIQIGERIIKGEIKEKEQAKRTFEKAKREGKKAGLLQQHRPNLFSIAVANIGPHEQVIANISFIDTVTYKDDVFSLTMPTTLTPRYVANGSTESIRLDENTQRQLEKDLNSNNNSEQQGSNNVEINTGNGWANNTVRVPDANDITPPQAHSLSNQASHRFSLFLSLNVGLDLQQVSSSTHPISSNVSGSSAQEVIVELANGHELMDRDLVLTWQPILGTAPKAAMFQQELATSSSGKEYFTMMMLAPPTTSVSLSLPRDVTFIVDSSGSMGGQPMQQAKQALHDALSRLSPSDKFNIVDFDSTYRTLYSQSQTASFDHIQSAKQMVDGLRADGGTEMTGALKFALNTAEDPNYLRQVIFITDGAIGNEAELFKIIDQDLANTRLFTVGIGSAPNAFFMSKAAKFGRGTYTYIRDTNQVQSKMATLFDKITKPVLRDLTIDWPSSAGKVEQYPSRLPDLYAGEPLTVLVRSSSPINSAQVQGSMLNTPWSQTLSLGSSSSNKDSDNLDTVWARKKVDTLMDKLHTGEEPLTTVKPMVTELGIKHHILTKFTAFVAVDKTPTRPDTLKSKSKNVPNLMPKGTTMKVPQTATPASLLSMLGALLMLISFIGRKRSFKLIGKRTHLTTNSLRGASDRGVKEPPVACRQSLAIKLFRNQGVFLKAWRVTPKNNNEECGKA